MNIFICQTPFQLFYAKEIINHFTVANTVKNTSLVFHSNLNLNPIDTTNKIKYFNLGNERGVLNRFIRFREAINKIDKITKPVLIMHGMKDDIVPYVMSVELFNKANKPKYSFFPKDDNHMMDFNDELLDKIRLFIKQH